MGPGRIRADLLSEADALIMSGETIRAIRFLKERMQCGLSDAVELLDIRSQELEEINESWRQSKLAYRQTLTPEYWRTHALASMEALPRPPLALEALWDGDSFGWMLELNAILPGASRAHPRFTAVCLVLMRGPSDHMIEVALETGRIAQERWKIALYLPSHEPSIDTPRWWDSHST
ncbi:MULTISPECIES: hypothetical protein [unclassified Corallococcus]|uniref:hypothetical protein n=1 Tax=unclassified Corallococcus TaxID=2685029 RepID=UPI001A8D14CF|nr:MULTISPECIES: hypothetical protein [unclassified Corallococcus]MBN9685197.1 hypothetical protein [Corallococcus sp. NCSPR001]WAS83344.1 hypothetical protein O0N60_29015 [Corallococcus sp. NCRR]